MNNFTLYKQKQALETISISQIISTVEFLGVHFINTGYV